jgi:hypothetical protein
MQPKHFATHLQAKAGKYNLRHQETNKQDGKDNQTFVEKARHPA